MNNRIIPSVLLDVTNKLILEGYSYNDITEELEKMGCEAEPAAVRKYGKEFLATLERLKATKKQAKAIVSAARCKNSSKELIDTIRAAKRMVQEIINNQNNYESEEKSHV